MIGVLKKDTNLEKDTQENTIKRLSSVFMLSYLIYT
jgi:hypothetical protein